MGSLTWEFVWCAQHPLTRLKVWSRQLPILLTSLVWPTNSPPMNRTSNTVVILISTIRWHPSKMLLREIGFFDTQNETMVLAAEMMLQFSSWFLSPLLCHSALRPMVLTLSASFESKQISSVHEYQRQKWNCNVSSSDLGSIIILLDLCCIRESRWRQKIQVGIAQSSNRTKCGFLMWLHHHQPLCIFWIAEWRISQCFLHTPLYFWWCRPPALFLPSCSWHAN